MRHVCQTKKKTVELGNFGNASNFGGKPRTVSEIRDKGERSSGLLGVAVVICNCRTALKFMKIDFLLKGQTVTETETGQLNAN